MPKRWDRPGRIEKLCFVIMVALAAWFVITAIVGRPEFLDSPALMMTLALAVVSLGSSERAARLRREIDRLQALLDTSDPRPPGDEPALGRPR